MSESIVIQPFTTLSADVKSESVPPAVLTSDVRITTPPALHGLHPGSESRPMTPFALPTPTSLLPSNTAATMTVAMASNTTTTDSSASNLPSTIIRTVTAPPVSSTTVATTSTTDTATASSNVNGVIH